MPEPISTLVAAAGAASGAVKATDDSLAVISKLVDKLRAQPDLAAMKLSAALDEVIKTYQVVDEAIIGYCSLAADPDTLPTKTRELLAIAGGSLEVQVANGRGHCVRISNIYHEHLHRWFEKVFNGDDLDAMYQAFLGPFGLGNADEDVFRKLETVAAQLTASADVSVPKALAGDWHGVRDDIVATYHELAPLRKEMAASMRRMATLKNDFIGLAGVT